MMFNSHKWRTKCLWLIPAFPSIYVYADVTRYLYETAHAICKHFVCVIRNASRRKERTVIFKVSLFYIYCVSAILCARTQKPFWHCSGQEVFFEATLAKRKFSYFLYCSYMPQNDTMLARVKAILMITVDSFTRKKNFNEKKCLRSKASALKVSGKDKCSGCLNERRNFISIWNVSRTFLSAFCDAQLQRADEASNDVL